MLSPRLALLLIPLLVLGALLVLRPLSIQGAPPAQPSPPEVISDAPVCVRYYPATGETREGPEICTTRAGDPPPPQAPGTSAGATGTRIDPWETPAPSTASQATLGAGATPAPTPPVATKVNDTAGTDRRGPASGLGGWLRRLFGD